MDKTKILIVDDRPENIFALSRLIEADDIEILKASSADEALDVLINNDCALALLDVHMPNVSGFELARLIRGVKRFRHLPMIFVTANQQDNSVIFEGYETGAVDLMFKPLDPHIVRTKVGVFVQLHRQQQMLQEQMNKLENLRIKAEAASLAKSQFLANMSHEIRTPLGAVLGFADVLLEDKVSENSREKCAAAIRRNGELLLRLIDDILDLSKVEAGKPELQESELSLDEAIHDVESILTVKAANKGISFKVTLESPIRKKYLADVNRIKQILLNVIGNAIKFTDKGGVEVGIQIKPDRAGHADKVIFQVKDSGIGLTRDQAERLFQPFSQGDPSTRRQFGGTGLGLVISRQIANAMGGDVALMESQFNQGSTFEISLYLKIANGTEITNKDEHPRGHIADINWKNKSILVVDDSVDNRIFVDLYLKSLEMSLFFAENGIQAIEMVEKNNPDLILMDIQMPGMDGCEATQRIRKMGFEGPIIALTAHALQDEKEKCLRAGCDFVLTKPILRQDLVSKLAEYLH